MPDMLVNTIRSKTALAEGYRQHAAPESMDVYIADWEEAAAILAQRTAELMAMAEERRRVRDRGDWPPDK